MTWDDTWEHVFRSRSWGKYPPEELIRFVMRSFSSVEDRKAVRVLEIGCGAGANIWFLAREGFSAVGIDGSKTAVRTACERLNSEGLTAELRTLDAQAIVSEFGRDSFDAVIDVACLQHNRMQDIARMVEQCHNVLKPGGRIFSMVVAAGSLGDGTGEPLDRGTYRNVTSGPAAGLGTVHFFTLDDVAGVFSVFSDVQVELSTRTMDERRASYSHWITQARKA